MTPELAVTNLIDKKNKQTIANPQTSPDISNCMPFTDAQNIEDTSKRNFFAGLDSSVELYQPTDTGNKEFASQQEGLRALDHFLLKKADFSIIPPFTLTTKAGNKDKKNARSFAYWVGRDDKRQYYLTFKAPEEVDMVFVIPQAELQKGASPYYWLDFYTDNIMPAPANDNEIKLPFKSCRLSPNTSPKIQFGGWHGIGEELLADYAHGSNNIAATDLVPFYMNVFNKWELVMYKFAGRPGLNLHLAENSQITNGDILRFTPGTDNKGKYTWLDITKAHPGTPSDAWPNVGSYRVLPEQKRISSLGWFGPDRQLLVDYMAGKPDITFDELRPIIATIPRRSKVIDLFHARRSYGISATFYFADGLVLSGDQVIAIPMQDKQKRYQWFDLYKYNANTKEIDTKRLTSARIENGKLNKRSWHGVEIQLLKDHIRGEVPFSSLEPVPLTVQDSLIASLWKEAGKEIYIPLSKRFGLQSGDQITLIPERGTGSTMYFKVSNGEESLGLYSLDTETILFKLEDVTHRTGLELHDKKTGRYIDKAGGRWLSLNRLKIETSVSSKFAALHLDNVRTISFKSTSSSIFYNETEAFAALENVKHFFTPRGPRGPRKLENKGANMQAKVDTQKLTVEQRTQIHEAFWVYISNNPGTGMSILEFTNKFLNGEQ